MKRLIFICLLFSMAGVSNNTFAQAGRNRDTAYPRAYVDSLKKAYSDSIRIYGDSLEKANLNAAANTTGTKGLDLGPNGNLMVVIFFFIVMVLVLVFFFIHVRYLNQRIGFQSIKLIGLILIFPGICILTIVGGTSILSGSTLAALLGTIAGYVLSRDDDSKDPTKKEAELQEKVTELEEKLKIIRAKNKNLVEA